MKINVREFHRPCACRRTHEIIVDDMITEEDAIQRLPHIMKTCCSGYKTIAMLCDGDTYVAAGKLVEELFPDVITIKSSPKNLHADEHGVEAAQEHLNKYVGIDFPIAAGLGTVHDITRYHTYEKKPPFLSIPAAASMDDYVFTVVIMA